MSSIKDKILGKLAGSKSLINGTVSINDLRDKEFNGEELTLEQKRALANFDRYRINALNSEEDEEKFNLKYLQLQAMANLAPYTDFLAEKFD